MENSFKSTFAIVFLFITLCTVAVKSEESYSTGYVILQGGEKQEGLIKNFSENEVISYCYFKKSKQDTIIKYSPLQIEEFRFTNDKKYVSENITLKNSSIKVFLEHIVDGEVGLYEFKASGSECFFYYSRKDLPKIEIYRLDESRPMNGSKTDSVKRALLNYFHFDHSVRYELGNIKDLNRRTLSYLAEIYHVSKNKKPDFEVFENKFSGSNSISFALGSEIGIVDLSPKRVNLVSVILYHQLPRMSENLHIGIGFDNNHCFDIPLSLAYFSYKTGLHPFYSAGLDLVSCGAFQHFQLGAIYKTKRISFTITEGLKTSAIFIPFSYSTRIGFAINI